MPKKPTKHIAAYLRVSTKQQTTDNQEADVDRWLRTNCEDGEEFQFYREKHTGTVMDRPVWNEVEAAIRAGEISKLVVWRVDRLGRTAKGLTALFSLLREHKVRFISIRDGIDLGTPAGRMLANVLASIAEFENDVRSERIRAGQQRAKAEGKRIGGGVKGRRCGMSKSQEEKIVALYEQGERISLISRATKVSRPWCYEVLRRHGLMEAKV